ncbi:serine protease [Jonesiaceae bacterium BS-20]|uniref:Serine protease n=1 Tax=Jonesiaceae bacterium BS-20 TaxID=3120821 RepID=A0AAU7DWP8_9MICO
MTHRFRLLGAGIALLFVTACGIVPDFPEPIPDYVPALPEAEPAHGSLTKYGFSEAQRIAVRVRNISCTDVIRGTGFAIDDRTLVTNKHVVEGTNKLQLSTYDGRDVDVTSSATAGIADLAIVRTTEDLETFPTIAEDDPEIGDLISIVGFPKGGELTVSQGMVLQYTEDPLNENLGKVILTDATVEPGSSGSAALDEEGRVIGVVYAKSNSGYTYIIPVSMLTGLLDDEASFVPQTESTCS